MCARDAPYFWSMDPLVVHIDDYIDTMFGISAKWFKSQCAQIKEGQDLELHINSGGGDINEGFIIYNFLRDLSAGRSINVFIDGMAASAASVIAMGGTNITISKSGRLLIHEPSVFMEGSADDLRKMADNMDQYKDLIVSAYQLKTGLPEDQILQWIKAETYFTADQALEHGFVDSICHDMKIAAAKADYWKYKQITIQNVLNSKGMTTKKKDDKKANPGGLLETIKNLLKTGKKVTISNILKTLKDGTTQIWIVPAGEGEQFGAGDFVFEAVDGGPTDTPLADGTYILEDDVTLVVTDGKIDTVTDAPTNTEEVEAIKAELEELKVEKAELVIANKKLIVTNAKLVKTIEDTEALMEELTQFIPGQAKKTAAAGKQTTVENKKKVVSEENDAFDKSAAAAKKILFGK